MKTKKSRLSFYLYSLDMGTNWGSGGFEYTKEKVGIVAPNKEFVLSVLEASCFGTHWGDVNEYEMRDADGGHKKYDLIEIIPLDEDLFYEVGFDEEVWDILQKNLTCKDINDINGVCKKNCFIVELEESDIMKLFFDAKEIVKQFDGLDSEKLDAICQAIQDLKKKKKK